MNKGAIVLVGAVAVLLYLKKQRIQSLMIDTRAALKNPNVKAFLALIRKPESNGIYNVLFGGGTFDDYSRHPNVRVPFHNPNRAPHADGTPNDYSTAAGAYQINYPTWLVIQSFAALEGIVLQDFSPESQDIAAVLLLKLDGALPLILHGHFSEALFEASGGDNGLWGWASLPGSNSGQHQITLASARQIYQVNGGTVIT